MNNATTKSIVIIEDDLEMAKLTQMLLEAEGYQCDIATDGVQGIEKVKAINPQLVLLDIMLPEKSGDEVCRELRTFYQGAILVITGQDSDLTELALLKSGADDYILKPIKPHILLARIEAVARRTLTSAKQVSTDIYINNLHIQPNNRAVSLNNGQNINLTSAEFDILLLLAEQAGKVVSRQACSEHLRGINYDSFDRSTDMRISGLRKKLAAADPSQSYIVTVRNKGYMFVNN